MSLAVVHDMNDDGRAEIAAGLPLTASARSAAGAVFVAFGKSTATTEAANLLSTNDQGFEVYGAAANDALGTSVDAGDFNGDGRGDVLIGAPHANGGTGADTSSSASPAPRTSISRAQRRRSLRSTGRPAAIAPEAPSPSCRT